MKTVSNKKKVPLPQMRILDCVPYIVVPQGVTNPSILFSNPNPEEKRPFEPCKEPVQNKTTSATKRKELTLLEEVEEYLRIEAAKEKASRSRKRTLSSLPSLPPSLYLISHS